jgi:hypothetical protein
VNLLRAALVLFLLALLFGPYWLRAAVPVWLPFLALAGLELHFFVGAIRAAPPAPPDRGPQPVDKELYGYPALDELEDDEESDYEDEEYEPAAPAWDRPRPRPVVRLLAGAALIGGLGLLLWLVNGRTGWDGLSSATRGKAEARFSAEASRIAGKPVTIRCDESGRHVGVVQHADGVARVGGDLAYLTPDRCLDLYRLAFKDEVRPSQTARSLAVLAHEAWHLRGVADEGTTECYALQSAVGLGQRLGLPEDRARQLMRQQLAENALRGAATFEYRVPADCRNGTPLDLDRSSSRFP